MSQKIQTQKIRETRVTRRNKLAFENDTRYIVHQGGTRSGKTFGNIISIFHLATSNPKVLISVVSENIPHLKRGAIRDFETIMYALGIQDQIDRNKQDNTYTFSNGSVVEFFAADNEGKARGSARDYLFVNEANNVKWEIFYQLYIRTKQQVMIDYNPSGEFWWHKKLRPSIDGNEYLFTRTTYKDNPALSPAIIKDIENLINVDENLYRIYAEGKMGVIQGLIFPVVGKIPEYPHVNSTIIGLDFGFTNDPTAAVEVGLQEGKIKGRELIYEKGLTNSDISDRLDSLGILKSQLIVADSAEPKSIEELSRMGWTVVGARKGKDSINWGIQRIKEYGIDVTTSSLNWSKEAKNYKYVSKDGEVLNKPIDKFNHCWDACRYGVERLISNTSDSNWMGVGFKEDYM